MPSLLDTIRTVVAVADKVTKPLQPEVQFAKYAGDDGQGTDAFAAPVPLRALVDWKQRQLRTSTGVLSVSRASVQFLDIDALVAATGGEGIQDKDLLTLSDGTTGPILDMSGFIDAGTGIPFATEVFLG